MNGVMRYLVSSTMHSVQNIGSNFTCGVSSDYLSGSEVDSIGSKEECPYLPPTTVHHPPPTTLSE